MIVRLFAFVCLCVPGISQAHFYVDFGLGTAWFDTECRAHITVINHGDGVPEYFHKQHKPVLLHITKGTQTAAEISVTEADKKQALTKMDGKVEIITEEVFANNPKPIRAHFSFAEEYGDYNQKNDHLELPIDCKPGQGQIAGDPIVYHQPDVYFEDAFINTKNCTIELVVGNRTKIPLTEMAWDTKNGVQIIQKNPATGKLLQNVFLTKLDPQQDFTQTTQQFTATLPIIKSKEQDTTFAIWYVKDDLEFSNNVKTLKIPRVCTVF